MIDTLAPRYSARASVAALFAVIVYSGYTMTIMGIAAPFIAIDFGLDDVGIARLFACTTPAALATLGLLRLSDRVGRRAVLLACITATPVMALVTAAGAGDIVLFVACVVALYSLSGTSTLIAVILLAEALPVQQRGRGQSYAGMAAAIGAVGGLILLPVLDVFGLSWRWLLLVAGLGLLWIPLLPMAIRESHYWARASTSGATTTTRLFDVFGSRYRARFCPLAASLFLKIVGIAASDAWIYYHAINSVGLNSAASSILVLVGGGISFVGFQLGAWSSERFGRVPTVVVGWLMACIGSVFFYWGPPSTMIDPVIWLAGSYFWLKTANNASIVGVRLASTELLPTALRGTMFGWVGLIAALGILVGQLSVALLANPLGGLSRAVGYLALLCIPAAYIFSRHIVETRGMNFDAAEASAGEHSSA